MPLTQFHCPSCGAGLDDPGAGATMRCPYCSTSVLVPAELIAARAAARPIPAPAAAGAVVPPIAKPASKRVLFQDDFTSPKNGWETGKQEGGVLLGYEAGAYRIWMPKDDWTWESFCDKDFGNFELEVDLARYKGPKDGEYGVTCRANDSGGYVFWISDDGYYGISKIYYAQNDDDDEYVDLGEGEKNILKPAPTFNRLKAECVGDRLAMYLNGHKVLEVSDDEFISGDVGLMVTTGESARGGLDIRFANLVIREA